MRAWMACATVLAAASIAAPAQADEASAASVPYALRVLRVPGPLHRDAARRHVDFGRARGFNGLWIASADAGRWSADEVPEGPRLDPSFVALAERSAATGVRLFVELRPVADAGGVFVFSDRAQRRRLMTFVRLLTKQGGVTDLVLSFDGAPLRLTELSDLLEHGRVAALAHVELTAVVARRVGHTVGLWLLPALSSDAELDDARLRYPARLFESLPRLPARVGVVWSGPQPFAPSIGADAVLRARARFGGRRIVLRDRFPDNGSAGKMPLALVLGPLRERDPAIARDVAAYVACPMTQLGASRLALSTVGDYLEDPSGYDPERSWHAAIARLAGDDAGVRDALRTQASEWGGWIGTPNYHTADSDNPFEAARLLRDPAAVARWGWVTRRYPDRMAALSRLADPAFRDELLLTMARRLAVARAMPLARDLGLAGGTDAAGALEQARTLRASLRDRPQVLEALDLFLFHAGIGRGHDQASQ